MTMKSYLISCILIGLSSLAVSVEVTPCPPIELIYPCYCDSEPGYTGIDCEKLQGLDKLKNALKATRGLNISYGIWKSRLGDIPSDLFEGQRSVEINFDDCRIHSFGDRPFTGLEETLKRLDIFGSVNRRVHDLKTFPVGHLKKLEYLSFQGNDINMIGNEWFRGGPETLSEIFLDANDAEMGDKLFADLVNLKSVWLGDNRMKVAYRSMFPRPANKLEHIEISFNDIKQLPEDMFTDMPALTVVNLSGNKLKSVPEVTWGKVWDQLDDVYLQRNVGFRCDDDLKWIYHRKPKNIIRGSCVEGKLRGKTLEEITLKDFE